MRRICIMTNQEIITAAGDLTAIYCMAAQSIILEKKEVQKNDCAGTLPGNLSRTKPNQNLNLHPN